MLWFIPDPRMLLPIISMYGMCHLTQYSFRYLFVDASGLFQGTGMIVRFLRMIQASFKELQLRSRLPIV